MDTLDGLLQGFAVAFTPVNLLWSLLGVTLGTAIGVLPGIGPALTIALLLPVTYHLDPTAAFIIFGGIYYGAMYGSSTTSILLNVPGETGSIVTAIDGHMMARKGRAAAALATAAIGSFVAGTIATVGLSFLSPIMVRIALLFGPAEYFSLMVLAFVTVSALLGSSILRGLSALFIGLAIGLIGIDTQTGQARFTFGLLPLLDGLDVVVVAVGLFALGEAFHVAFREARRPEEISSVTGSLWMSRQDWARSWKPWLRGTALGFPLGSLPAGGTEIPTFLSYLVEKRLSRKPQEFGQGAIEAVAGPEAANNAAVAGVLVPLLSFGLPTSATAAILLAAFQQYGIQPGPMLFSSNSTLVWALIASLYLGNLMLLVLNLPLVGLWAKLLLIPRPLLYGGILVLSMLGVYSLNNSVFDLWLLLGIGLLGFAMRQFEYPVAPLVVGLILGPMAEEQFRRAYAIAQGDVSVFFTHPISALLLAIASACVIGPFLLRRRRSSRG
ncbi:tripartite tricarboxylate transporter permease [Dongia sp.]|uniref:tripartite tricarboxylate transporter permease n=1 Tax=Dongia sp. TaxID=1977262 RepID=UPI0035B27D88